MGEASFTVGNFLGGEISQFAQGRFDKPDYRYSMKTCLNSFPNEIGTWIRRPGTQNASHTRGGVKGREIKFDFNQVTPVKIELVDGYMRFRQGNALLSTNDQQNVAAISAANPAVVNVASAWPTGGTVMFGNLGANCPLLQNRQFTTTNVDATHLSLQDALTGATIDGSTLGTFTGTPTVSRIQELTTPYIGGSWATVRLVQAETTGILLQGTIPPQALTVASPFGPGVSAQFALSPAIFNDGPYLDPLTNGAQVTPSAKSGIINLSLGFPLYSAALAYAKGTFVTDVGINYISLADQNVGHTPASSPSFWATTPAGAAVGPNGFQGSDIGRLMRLFSEPPLWNSGATYAAGAVVTYNPSGVPGASTYWQSATAGNINHPPGSDLTNWSLIAQGAAIWSWGKIVGLSNAIDRALAGSTNIGDMTFGAGLNAAFNGSFSQGSASSADGAVFGGFLPANTPVVLISYVGKNYGASPQAIQQVTIYPSSDNGFAIGSFAPLGGGFGVFSTTIQLILRAKNTAPSSASDGTQLATTTPSANTFSSVTLISSDQVTAWQYVWVEIIVTSSVTPAGASSYTMTSVIAQLSFFNPPGVGTSSGVQLEILGPALLYTNSILTWRLGAYSNTTGFPTCGCYADGRLWLGGAIPNRFDASTSNGIVPGSSVVNFAPTDQYGVVAASAAISETLNSDSANPIFWMKPDLQGILMGTQEGEYLVLAPTSGSIAPANITARHVTNIGSSFIEPARTDHTIAFIKRYGRKLMEYFPDVYSGKYSAPNLADKAEHIPVTGIAEIAYTDAVTPVIWGRNTDGSWFGITYKRDSLASAQPPTFYGWHRHLLGSGRVIESICAGPSVGGNLDAISLVTNDPLTNIRHVEVMTDTMGELSALANSWFLDNAVAPSSTVASNVPAPGAPFGGLTINGLWHLNGQTVQVFAGGIDCGDPGEGLPFSDFVVSNGSVFVPYGDTLTRGPGRGLFTAAFVATNPPIVVGFTYNSDGQLVRPISPPDSGSRHANAFGVLSRAHRYALKLVNTLGLSVGGTFGKIRPVNTKQAGAAPLPPLTTFTGISQEALEDDYDYDRGLCWRVSRPFPANVVVAGVNLATQDQ